jgi:hypothetical protein
MILIINKKRWLKQIGEYGICIVKGVTCEEGMVKKLAELIAPVQNTIYGEIFDVKVDRNPINIAYSDVALGFYFFLLFFHFKIKELKHLILNM